MDLGIDVEEWKEKPPERLVFGKYGEMSNRERAIRAYSSLVLAVPFANLLMTSSPSAGRAVVALVSFGVSFAVGWRALYETLHVGDDVDDTSEPVADVEEGSSP